MSTISLRSLTLFELVQRCLWRVIVAVVMGTPERLLLWHERARQRHALAALPDRALKDIGLSRAEAERESLKPFWRP